METAELISERVLSSEPGIAIDEANGHAETRTIPDIFIYEMWEGKPVYYRGYQDCLDNPKQFEKCIGSSIYQSLVISTLLRYLFNHLPLQYVALTNELGVLLNKKSWLSADIAICEKAQIEAIPAASEQTQYLHFAPKVVIEIDTKADVTDFDSITDYYLKKTDALLDFGVERVVWIFTSAKKVMTATKGSPWLMVEWDVSVEILDGISVSLVKDLNL
jgi:Uma2 family endonuclease